MPLVTPGEANAAAIVNTQSVYSYKTMERDLERLAAAYPDLVDYQSLGETPYGRGLYAVKIGRGDATVFLNASHHAREWMTTTVLMKMAEAYAEGYYTNARLGTYDLRELLDRVTIWMVPMVNPDGVTLSQQGTAGLPPELAAALQRMNGGSPGFARWKANMQGIDLNRQYPVDWDDIRNAAKYPWYQNYKGNRPAQAAEVQTVMDFTHAIDPEVAIAYHSSGEIIFWHYRTAAANVSRDREMARALSRITGYGLVQPQSSPSGGGYKDWFIQEFGRPGFTIEIGRYAGERPLPLSAFDRIWGQNKTVGAYAADKAYDLWYAKQTLEPVGRRQSLLAQVKGYAFPGASQSAALLDPQTVTVHFRKGNWSQVTAGNETVWISPAPGSLIEPEPIQGTVELAATAPLYKYPDPFAPKTMFVQPQRLNVVGSWDRWLLIAAHNGSWWLDGAGLTVLPAEPETPASEPDAGQEQPPAEQPVQPEPAADPETPAIQGTVIKGTDVP